jgi:hypothetical protein
MKYTELKKQYQDKLTILHDKVGLFWAFNREQLAEGMKKNPADKYVHIGMGGYLPKINVNAYLSGLKELDKWYKAEMKSFREDNKKRVEAILYELNNYECFYTGDITDAYEVLAATYTKAEVLAVYRKYKAQKYAQ